MVEQRRLEEAPQPSVDGLFIAQLMRALKRFDAEGLKDIIRREAVAQTLESKPAEDDIIANKNPLNNLSVRLLWARRFGTLLLFGNNIL